MADTRRETERTYEHASDGTALPDLTRLPGVAAVADRGTDHLDATYYDTPGLRLAADALTLRRRTSGPDAGWHLTFPGAPGVPDEVRAPLSGTVPRRLTGLLRSRVRDDALLPLVRLRAERAVRHLLDADGRLLAEVGAGTVHAERLTGDGRTARWTEVAVHLAEGVDPAFLDAVDTRLRTAGIHPSPSPSPQARALTRTGVAPPRRPAGPPVTAGDHVLAHVRAQRDALVALDPAVRRDLPDAVHRMRVATRRLRSTFRSYRGVLDRAVTDPLAAELTWLAGELGADRDREVLTDRLTAALDDLPRALVTGPVRARLRTWSRARHDGSRRHLLGVLDSRRHLDLLDAVDALIAAPPLRDAAAKKPGKVITKAVRKDVATLTGRVEHALALPPGEDRDRALHEARKKAKRARYAAQAAAPALGGPAARLVRATRTLQNLLGEHQDGVMARRALRDLARSAHEAGESAFTYGVLYAREERRAELTEAALPETWRGIARRLKL